MNKTTKTIDATPTWEAITPMLLHILRNSSNREVEQEFLNMARAADRWNAFCKESK